MVKTKYTLLQEFLEIIAFAIYPLLLVVYFSSSYFSFFNATVDRFYLTFHIVNSTRILFPLAIAIILLCKKTSFQKYKNTSHQKISKNNNNIDNVSIPDISFHDLIIKSLKFKDTRSLLYGIIMFVLLVIFIGSAGSFIIDSIDMIRCNDPTTPLNPCNDPKYCCTHFAGSNNVVCRNTIACGGPPVKLSANGYFLYQYILNIIFLLLEIVMILVTTKLNKR